MSLKKNLIWILRVKDKIINDFRSLGYKIGEPKILYAPDYGVPQIRKRVVFVGLLGSTEEFDYPRPICKPENYVTCEQAIGDLPSLIDAKTSISFSFLYSIFLPKGIYLMAITNFIPTIWSENLFSELDKQYIAVANCNREYEGDIREQGNTVKICGLGTITVSSYTKNANMKTPETLSDTACDLVINQAKYFNFQIDDIDRAQATPRLMDAAMKNAASALASSVLPTPVGPMKRKEPIGRRGSRMPARERRIASATLETASSCPITRRCRISSRRSSLSRSPSRSFERGIPVQADTVFAISSSVTARMFA